MKGFGIVIGLGTLMFVLALIAIIVLSPAEALQSNPLSVPTNEQQQEQKGPAPTVQDQMQKVQRDTSRQVVLVTTLTEQSKKTSNKVDKIEAQLSNHGLLIYVLLALAGSSLIVAIWPSSGHRKTQSRLDELNAAQAGIGLRFDTVSKQITEIETVLHQATQQLKQLETDVRRLTPSAKGANIVSSDDKLPPIPTDHQIASRIDRPNRQTAIALDQVRRLVENSESSRADEYRKAAEAIGHPVVLTIDNGTLRAAPDEDDGIKRWLIALLDNDGYGFLAPSHDYVKDFNAYHKVGAPATVLLATFFEIDITSDGTLRYVEPCYVRLVGSEFIAEGRGKLSGFSH